MNVGVLEDRLEDGVAAEPGTVVTSHKHGEVP